MPNPWDIGSARLLAQSGFKALATTSAGFAWSEGRPDYGLTLDDVLAHLIEMAQAVPLPINADFEGGFAVEPADLVENVWRAASSGVAGLSIEDSTGDAAQPLFDFTLAVERMRAARRGVDESGTGVVLTGRSEGFIAGRPDLKETIRRLIAYAEAGAECVYAPGLRSLDDIATLVRAVAPVPVNVLMSTGLATVTQLADLGVRRISVGGALARAAWTGVLDAVRDIAEQGSFARLESSVSAAVLNERFRRDVH